MEKMKTAKELRKEAEAIILGKVTNREQYELAKHDLVRPGKAVWSKRSEE